LRKGRRRRKKERDEKESRRRESETKEDKISIVSRTARSRRRRGYKPFAPIPARHLREGPSDLFCLYPDVPVHTQTRNFFLAMALTTCMVESN